MKNLYFALNLIFIVSMFTSCESCQRKQQNIEHPTKPAKKTTQYEAKIFNQFLIEQIEKHETVEPLVARIWKQSINQGNYYPIINNEKSLDAFIELLEKSDEHGLGFYFKNDLESLKGHADNFKAAEKSNENLAKMEFELRNIAIKYNKALHFGVLNPQELFPSEYFIHHNKADSTWYSKEFTEKNYIAFLQDFQPKHIHYKPLQKAYEKFKENPDQYYKELPALPKRILEEGDKYEGAPELRVKFGIPPIADTLPEQYIYDSLLVEKIKSFQAEFNLSSDGVIGPSTLDMLNTSPEQIQQKIEASLERFRWNTNLKFDNLLLVNIPEYRLHVYEKGKQVLNKKIGVGLANNQHNTPEFIDTMRFVVVNPTWNLPYSIATNEVLPKAQMDPSYLTANNYKVLSGGQEINPYSVNWQSYNASNFPYRFTQAAGPGNALGRIKFLFPNKYAIYLHDTPSKHIFKRDKRAVSHGCIRVENPFELGDFLMAGNKEYQSAKNSDATVQFNVEKPYPVFITYFTTWADDNGKLQYRADVYNRDRKIVEAFTQLKGTKTEEN